MTRREEIEEKARELSMHQGLPVFIKLMEMAMFVDSNSVALEWLNTALEKRLKAYEELVSLAASFMSEEDVSHYSTAVTFREKFKALKESKEL